MNPSRSEASSTCFHCQEPLAGSTLTAHIGARAEPVCCIGCRAVAEMIAGSGLAEYYVRRTASSPRPNEATQSAAWQAYVDPAVAAEFVRTGAATESIDLLVENLRCSACGWLIERTLSRLAGVTVVEVNAVLGRAHIEWRPGASRFEDVMRTIAQLGYEPHPITEETTSRVYCNERRSMLKRFIVAAFGMMQVMMFAVAGYSAELSGERIDATLELYFRIVSLLVSIPVLFYAGKPFLSNGWNNLRTRSIGMDLPVSAALLLAFVASVWNTLARDGEVYFDSITMFVFFLTLTRFIELSVRHRTNSVADALARHLPATAQRVAADTVATIATHQLRSGDEVIVATGATVPADGMIVAGVTTLNEALLTGESLPVTRQPGDRVASGSINTGAPIRIAITAIGANTLLSSIVALLRRAQTQKPLTVQSADRAAAMFLRVVLITSVLVCAAWLVFDPSRAFAATLAVLVVACPCAFSIATPAALAASTAQLARDGVLVVRPDALETLARIDHAIFDKTGTLTRGELHIDACTTSGSRTREECLAIAAALERSSAHPIASAFKNAPVGGWVATQIVTSAGHGIEGTIDGTRYRLGTEEFVAQACGTKPAHATRETSGTSIVLGNEQEVLAQFVLSDILRADSREAVARLRTLGIDTEILSGDGQAAVAAVAERCEVDSFSTRCTPEQKLTRVRELQGERKTVAMIGDGINDAPVLGAADISIAMGRGAALAIAAADLILVAEKPSALVGVIVTARRTLEIARQNRVWSATYNFCALPLAAFGFIPPWLAALGMSLSSLFVLSNALRLLPRRSARQPSAPEQHALLPAARAPSPAS